MKPLRLRLAIAALLLVAPALLHADKDDDPNARYKAALSHGDVDGAVAIICDAAKADPKKYDKKCESARQSADKQAQASIALLASGKAAMDRKDYPAAVRDLSKITSGPNRPEAQRLLEQANAGLNHPQMLADDRKAYAAAQAAYDRGDFAAAVASTNQIKTDEMKQLSKQLLGNIHVYNDAMKAGDAAMEAKNYQVAQQRYTFAKTVKSNGPGELAGKLQQVAALIAVSASNQAKISPPAPPQPLPPISTQGKGKNRDPKPQPPGPPPAPPIDTAAIKIKAFLDQAHAAEARNNPEAALAAYERVLGLDAKQPDALAGKEKIVAALQNDSNALEAKLTTGIRDFYNSHLSEASDAISLYLLGGKAQHKGAAHFYLGATFAAKSLLADTEQRSLKRLALQEFQLAKREHYKPIDHLIAPKILSVWNESPA